MAQASTTEVGSDIAAPQVRVAVVDDHESVRLGLKAAFLAEGYDFVLAAPTVSELVEGLDGREVDLFGHIGRRMTTHSAEGDANRRESLRGIASIV